MEFERERRMLEVLANHPHQYIVPFITSWTQMDEHYILYPAARYNLREFMQNVKPVGFTKHETLWFLRQLQGLAQAIEHVHKLKNPTNTEPNPKEDAYRGSHFDIKPENILIFEKVEGYHSHFKIGDFGSGVFNPAVGPVKNSQLTSEAKGSVAYFAPDKERSGMVSRPFDMWALGCVYLELMLWLFEVFKPEPGKRGFSTARFDCTGADPKKRKDKFWDAATTSEGTIYKLKSAVKQVVESLKEKRCSEMPAFQGIMTAVDNLFEIEADKRMKAEDLSTRITGIVQQAEQDLKNNGEFYSSQYETNRDAYSGSTQESNTTQEELQYEQSSRPAEAVG